MIKLAIKILTLISLISPALAFGLEDGVIFTYLELASFWVVQLVFMVIAAAIVVFFWGVAQYIGGGDDEEKRSKARNTMIYGIIGIFSMVSIWGLVYFMADVLGI